MPQSLVRAPSAGKYKGNTHSYRIKKVKETISDDWSLFYFGLNEKIDTKKAVTRWITALKGIKSDYNVVRVPA